MRGGSTTFLRKRHPVILAVIDVVCHRISTAVAIILLGGGFTFNSCRHAELAKKVEVAATVATNNAAAIGEISNYLTQ